MPSIAKTDLKVADEVWIITALLHRENPSEEDFTIEQIMERAKVEKVVSDLRPGFYVHVVQHCVANLAPNPGRYRMLMESRKGYRRLFRPSDHAHPDRDGGKIFPKREDLPEQYRDLLDWYQTDYSVKRILREEDDPILRLRGLGEEIWKGVDPDEYVRQLREGWE
jgi:hypothetical protein